MSKVLPLQYMCNTFKCERIMFLSVQGIFNTAEIIMTTVTATRAATPPPVGGTARTATKSSIPPGPKEASYCTLESHSRGVSSRTALCYGP